MQIDPLLALLQTIKPLLDEALPADLARSLSKDIESKVQEVLKILSLLPKQEFENLEALVTTLETKIHYLEQRLAEVEKVGATSSSTFDDN
ncbi:hypothetical protein OBB00_07230 [Gammaproteobacteria bacterium]|nr:hypothetical protein [Gammaproteobacteria bacterium]